MDFKVGDMVEAKAGTLAHFCGDKHGTVEAFDGDSVMVRMDTSGRLVPFSRDQLAAMHRPPKLIFMEHDDWGGAY